jgi:putative transposase
MGSTGDAYDNAAAESLMSTIKAELVHRNRFKTKNEARFEVFRYIEGFYNPLRRHSSIGYMSPADYERMFEDAPAVAAVSS